MREIINKHGKWIIAGSLVLAVVAWLLLRRGSSLPDARENPSYGFYIDEATGEESVHPVVEIPPLAGKDGKPTVVRAVKFTCDDGKTVEVGYYLKYPQEVRDALAGMPEDDFRKPRLLESAKLVRLPKAGSQWANINSPEGQQIAQGPPCSSGTLREVYPPTP